MFIGLQAHRALNMQASLHIQCPVSLYSARSAMLLGFIRVHLCYSWLNSSLYKTNLFLHTISYSACGKDILLGLRVLQGAVPSTHRLALFAIYAYDVKEFSHHNQPVVHAFLGQVCRVVGHSNSSYVFEKLDVFP